MVGNLIGQNRFVRERIQQRLVFEKAHEIVLFTSFSTCVRGEQVSSEALAVRILEITAEYSAASDVVIAEALAFGGGWGWDS
jgi:hypothetical protein